MRSGCLPLARHRCGQVVVHRMALLLPCKAITLSALRLTKVMAALNWVVPGISPCTHEQPCCIITPSKAFAHHPTSTYDQPFYI